jgi:NitT/TauT family transport system substrate-binding protein
MGSCKRIAYSGKTQVIGQANVSRRGFLGAAGALSAAALLTLGGCASGSQTSGASGLNGSLPSIVIGTLPTEDILPMWVADNEGLFGAAGLSVQITEFQSATELIAGVSSGDVSFAMTDPMVAASMYASGTDLSLEWVTLGTTPQQGRFGIMVGPDSNVQSLSELAGVPIGVGTNTVLEYVMDVLMERAGVPDSQIVVQELQKLPVRYQAMASGQVAAAALPGSLLALGEASGARTIADDTTGDNISQSVMIARTDFLGKTGGTDALAALEGVWNQAATEINDDPEKYRALLVQKANLAESVAQTYPISQYPQVERPTSDMVEPVLEWMADKGYLTVGLTYDQATGKFARA